MITSDNDSSSFYFVYRMSYFVYR